MNDIKWPVLYLRLTENSECKGHIIKSHKKYMKEKPEI